MSEFDSIKKDIEILKENDKRHFSHVKDIRESMELMNSNMQRITDAIAGNSFNGGGIAQQQKEIKDELDELRTFKGEVDVYLRQAKFVIGGIIIAIISIGVKIFSK